MIKKPYSMASKKFGQLQNMERATRLIINSNL